LEKKWGKRGNVPRRSRGVQIIIVVPKKKSGRKRGEGRGSIIPENKLRETPNN